GAATADQVAVVVECGSARVEPAQFAQRQLAARGEGLPEGLQAVSQAPEPLTGLRRQRLGGCGTAFTRTLELAGKPVLGGLGPAQPGVDSGLQGSARLR